MNTISISRVLRYIAVIIALVAVTPAFGQGKIRKLISDMEKRPGVTATYTEKRTRDSHKLYRITCVLKFTNDVYYNQLAKAFDDERNNTVSATKDGVSRVYRFQDKNSSSTFTLSKNGSFYVVVMNWRDNKIGAKEGDESSMVVDNYGCPIDYAVNVSYTVNGQEFHAMREQARQAREQARIAREQARMAREQARQARKQAERAKKEARRQCQQAYNRL